MAVALVLAACGGSSDEAGDETGAAAGSETATTVATTAVDETVDGVGGSDGSELLAIDPADGPTESVVVSALGGVRFDYPADMAVLSLEDVILVHPVGADPNERSASVHLVTQLASGGPVDDLDTYFEAVEASHRVEPTGTSISLHGFDLEGYEIIGPVETQIFANSRHPAPVQAAGGPSMYSVLFVGETPSGILTVGVGGRVPDDADAMWPSLGTMLDSFEFVGPGLDPALPPGEAIEPADAGPPPPAAEGADDAAPPLGAPFSPAAAGRHELLNFGQAISVDFDDNWFVQPNFPGVVVLTHPDSIGPNDRDIVFINSIAELVPIAAGPLRAGDGVDVSDIERLLESPPTGLSISDVERFELAAPGGATTPVVSFAVEVDSAASCSPTEPCEFAFVTSYGFVKPVRHIDDSRVWWFPDHPHGPAAAVAAGSPTTGWMTEAEALMATLELSR